MRRTILRIGATLAALASLTSAPAAFNALFISPDDPAIQYSTRPARDPIAELSRKIRQGETHLKFDPANGYLRPLLEALDIPVESQLAVFSKTSFQTNGVGPHNPRSIFFNDSVTIAWLRGAWTVELAAQDPEQGAIFYTLNQQLTEMPVFQRRNDCLSCHNSHNTAGVPGLLTRSVFTARDGAPLFQLGSYYTDHSSPLEQRWGGWYVTGKSGGARHMGNSDAPAPAANDLANLEGKIDTGAYLSSYSDIVALMVFDHQTRALNLITRANWESRYAAQRHAPQAPDAAIALADYLMFLDETPLHARIEGSSGFDRNFAARAPRDSQSRSLRQFDLERHLMRYPCSYMIYSPAFDALPPETRDTVYRRMWSVLSAKDRNDAHATWTQSDRQAAIEILRETKPGLPKYFWN